MIHFTCNRCHDKLKTVHGAHLINAERIDFCEACELAFRDWLKTAPPKVEAKT